ncbi:hypothetical protein CDV31_000900 [Fusarium ambrosium]|uniref:IDI-2 n=1 Tax=Fusarium ambrosium TaxID=131363 RepID=A0A428V0V5_9HYPO|nr:hypothetical protein CDV31_000900 [Fusarium ambrosium]
MKFSTFALFAFQAACVFSMPTSADNECGDLGVMDWSAVDLPDYVDSSSLRKCKEHPENIVSPNKRDESNVLQERACSPPGEHGKRWGCSKGGYCWINCGSLLRGEWCWEAMNYGTGEWSKCKEDDDCYRNMERGARCSVGDCKACGCGC